MTDTRFLLHIGANKTGTSSIQKMLFENRAVLHEAGWDYPDFHLLYMAHHRVAYSLKAHPLALKGDWRKEIGQITRDPSRKSVWSSELFFRTVDPRSVATIFPAGQTKVVLYLRDHLSYMMSWYAQSVQERNLTASFLEFVMLNRQPLSGFVSNWDKVYGQENVIIRVFDRHQLVGRDVRADFVQQIDGLDPAKIDLTAADSNLSISGNLLFFKKVLNCFMTREESTAFPIPDEFGAFAAVKPSFTGRFVVSKAEVDKVKQIFAKDIDALAERGVVLPPMPDSVEGNAVPDFATLQEDLELIRRIAIGTNKRFLEYARRLYDWPND